jgi:hypothetical protein
MRGGRRAAAFFRQLAVRRDALRTDLSKSRVAARHPGGWRNSKIEKREGVVPPAVVRAAAAQVAGGPPFVSARVEDQRAASCLPRSKVVTKR